MIDDKFIVVKMFFMILLGFLDPDKVFQASVIDDLFSSFINVYTPHILPMSKGIDYLSNIYVKKLT
jgi:hypothetical protein